MALTKVLIAVKTYPTISTKYEELVCTAGFLENGQWIRIYPVQYRKKSYAEQYKKYQWIEIDLVKNKEDFRPESFRPVSHDTEINVIGTIEPDRGSWDERRKFVLNKVHTNLATLIAEAKDKQTCTSLAVFKPSEILGINVKSVDREWDKEKLQALNQLNIFEKELSDKPKVVRKLPYEFSYVFKDDSGKQSTLMIEDWELGELYWNCLRMYKDEAVACQKVVNKYFDDFATTKDIHFYLGTTKQFHFVAPNPFVVIGVFYGKFQSKLAKQLRLF